MFHGCWRKQAYEEHFVRSMVVGGRAGSSLACGEPCLPVVVVSVAVLVMMMPMMVLMMMKMMRMMMMMMMLVVAVAGRIICMALARMVV
jgi:hypothetical protein